MGISEGSLGAAEHNLRRVATPGSFAYAVAFVLYVAAMVLFFGGLWQVFLMALRGNFLEAVGYLVGAFVPWWLLAGIAIRLGVAPSVFFSKLGAFLDR